jgi:hypothetical protein
VEESKGDGQHVTMGKLPISQAIHPMPYIAITDIIQSPRGTSAASEAVGRVATSVDMMCPASFARSSIKLVSLSQKSIHLGFNTAAGLLCLTRYVPEGGGWWVQHYYYYNYSSIQTSRHMFMWYSMQKSIQESQQSCSILPS